MPATDRRLIEDFLPIAAIGAESGREKSTRKGHISTLHLWWARRPLVASRAAVYAALVPSPDGLGTGAPRASAERAAAGKFVEQLCKYPGTGTVIRVAQQQILAVHAERLSRETGRTVSVDDLVLGVAPRPKVLDMFAGGGAIPLEAARLGCDAYALDLNPVAHLIELCTILYPQRYGKLDGAARGSADDGTWNGLSKEVEHWGRWVLDRVKAEIGGLYPLIPDPSPDAGESQQSEMRFATQGLSQGPVGRPLLTPVAYLWTRTVRCKNPTCGATVPLVRQTWLCKRKGRYVAMRLTARSGEKRVRFDIVETQAADALGFDPEGFSKGGNAVCPFCGTVADVDYVKREGGEGRIGYQAMAVVCTQKGHVGKRYLPVGSTPGAAPDELEIAARIAALGSRWNVDVPHEPLPPQGTLGFRVQAYGIRRWGDLFLPRQQLCLLLFAAAIHEAEQLVRDNTADVEKAKAISSYLGLALDRVAMFGNTLCAWYYQEQAVSGTFSRQALPMLWDFAEVSLHADISGGIEGGIARIVEAIELVSDLPPAKDVVRGAAQELPFDSGSMDAVITDPPYYDNIPYADLSDFFYVWLKRAIGQLYPEHFASELTPKKVEAIAEPARYGGNKLTAKTKYEEMMMTSFREAWRVLKPEGIMVVVYAHKTTLGWSTLVEALRGAGFTVTEAWPVDTEGPGRLRAHGSAALATSIFLVARKREGASVGSYEGEVRPELELLIRERVDVLWGMGIAGADLVIAAVGAGLRAFSRFASVEYANGEEVPAERFLAEVEGLVLETLLEKIFGLAGSGVSAIDGPSRLYVLWRFAYGAVELEAGEAIVFTYGQPVELDGPRGVSSGSRPLVQKKKASFRLLDFTERGASDRLGLSTNAVAASLIDVLHRALWLLEHDPGQLATFLSEANPDADGLRLLAQTLAGAGLKGNPAENGRPAITTTGAEQTALAKLLANWRTLIEQQLPAPQGPLFAASV